MLDENKTSEPSEAKPVGNGDEVGAKDGFELNPKYKSVQEQAKAYDEAQKLITRKSQEVADLKKQLQESAMLFENLNGDKGLSAKTEAVKSSDLTSQNESINSQKVLNNKLDVLKSAHQGEINKITSMYKSGQISLGQAVKLKEHLDKKMNENTKNVLDLANNMQNEIVELRKNKTIESFKAQKPDFFTSGERLEVVDYLKNATEDLTPEELEAVSKLVEKVENGAIERFKLSQSQLELVDKANEEAKVRLSSTVEDAGLNSGVEKVFSKNEIMKMSNKDFRKNEKQIMTQMRAGKIK